MKSSSNLWLILSVGVGQGTSDDGRSAVLTRRFCAGRRERVGMHAVSGGLAGRQFPPRTGSCQGQLEISRSGGPLSARAARKERGRRQGSGQRAGQARGRGETG